MVFKSHQQSNALKGLAAHPCFLFAQAYWIGVADELKN
jgi:hypothetical protein